MGDRTPNPAVARVTAIEGNGLSQGSGTLVEVRGQRGILLTNWHVVRDARGPIVVTFPDGFRSAATVLKVDRDWDLAALLIWRPNAAPLAISTTAPRPGDPLTIAGYGSGNYRAVTGRCTQYVAPGAHMPYEMVEVAVEARQGDSGGPILNERGELAGVLFGSGSGTTSGSFSGRVRSFLASAWPAEQAQDASLLVAVPSPQTNTHWPTERPVAIPPAATSTAPAVTGPMADDSIGSTLPSATISIGRLHNSSGAVTLKTLAGVTSIEQAKSFFAVIGLLTIVWRMARVLGRQNPARSVRSRLH
ncbi:MAG: serine protease [Pirellulaceae bacterium]